MIVKSKYGNVLSRLLLYVAVGFVVFLIVFPLYWMVSTSLQLKGELLSYPPSLFPIKLSLASYVKIFTERRLVDWLRNTLVISLFTTLITMVLGSFAAYSLSRFQYRTKGVFILMILATQMFPGVLLAIPLYIIFTQLHINDTLLSLILGDTAFILPVCVWLLKNQFEAVPVSIEDAAVIDGCGTMGVLWRIVIPISAPGIVATGIISFLLAWGEFLLARTFILSEDNWVFSIALPSFRGEFELLWGQMMATATLFILPPVVFFIVLQRYIVSGITAGAVKG